MEDTCDTEIIRGQGIKPAVSFGLSEVKDDLEEVLLPDAVQVGEDRILEEDCPGVCCLQCPS